MVSWSSILSRAGGPVKGFVMLNKTPFLRNNVSIKIPIRNSHGEEMWIRPERHNWELFKDFLHLYTSIAVIIYGGIILYSNIYIGPAKLAQIPEGYVPKHWEYYRHPITRYISYIFPSEQEKYERKLHYAYELAEKVKYDQTLRKVRELQNTRQDFKAWYYQPNVNKRYLDQFYEDKKERHHEPYGGIGGAYQG